MPSAFDLIGQIDADTRRFDQKATAVERRLQKLASSDPSIDIDVEEREALADIQSVEQALAQIDPGVATITGDGTEATSEIQSVEAALAGIEDEQVGITADGAQATAEVQGVEAALVGIEDESVAVTADGAQARAEVQSVEQALVGIEDQEVRVTADTQTAQANVQSLEAALAGLEDQTVTVTQETQQAGVAAAGMGGSLRGAAATAGLLRGSIAGIASGGVAMGIWNVASASSDLAESLNVVDINFGGARDQMLDFTRDAPRSLGVSTRAANELSAGLAGLLGNMGFAQDETVQWSQDLLRLGADMGSAFNVEPAEAIMAIGSALRGETEPIRRFNVMLSAAKVESEAVTMGLHDGEGALTDYAKAAATLNIIMRQTEKIQGDFSNTADGMANSTRTLGGEFENLRAELGENLAPAIASVSGALSDWMNDVSGSSSALGTLVAEVFTFGLATQDSADAADNAKRPVRDLTAEQYNLAESARTGRDASEGLDAGVEGVADAARNARRPVDDFATAIDRIIGKSLDSEAAHLRWEESLLRLEGSLRENGHHLDGMSDKHLALKGDILSTVESTLDYASAMQTEGVEAGKVNTFLSTARQRMIDKMVAEGMAREEAERHLFTLGFTKEALDRVANATDTAKHRTNEMKAAIETARGATFLATGVFGGWAGQLVTTGGVTDTTKGKTDSLKGSVDRSGGAAIEAKGKFDTYKLGIDAVPNDKTTRVHTPGLAEALEGFRRMGGIAESIPGLITLGFKVQEGDGPGRPPGRGGPALARVQQAMQGIPGLRITSTYRSPEHNRRIGGAPNSYHMDRANPAVDIGGPIRSLDQLAAKLRMMGGWREGPIWRAPGHYDHVHVAHEGGVVDRSWGTLPGLRSDERPVIAQVGEGILSVGEMAALASSGGSSQPVVAAPSVTYNPTYQLIINAPVYGVADLQAAFDQMAEAHDRKFLGNLDQLGVRS